MQCGHPPLGGQLEEEVSRPPARRRVRYPKESGRDAAAHVVGQHRTIADVARERGVIEQILGNWLRQEGIDRGMREGTTTGLRDENSRVRREVRHLTMERNLQKGETAFW